jgi:hypothetical protein
MMVPTSSHSASLSLSLSLNLSQSNIPPGEDIEVVAERKEHVN